MPKIDPERRLLAFDFGTRHIGIAIGQLITKTATPLTTISYQHNQLDWNKIQELLTEWDIQAFIVGIPLNMDGSEQEITAHTRQFIQELKERFTLPVYEVDERLSTVYAKSELFEQGGYKALSKENIDKNSAKVILEQWMKNYGST